MDENKWNMKMKNPLCKFFKHKWIADPNVTITVANKTFELLKCKRCECETLRDPVSKKIHPWGGKGKIFIEYIS
jgi:hypothetical protein